jgi:hypothetical protein
MNRQEQIAREMAAKRHSGAASADRLPAAWNRAKDWREYVRAFPLQSTAAAALAGFAIVPKRKAEPDQAARDFHFENRRVRDAGDTSPAKAERGFLTSLAAPVRPWAAALATQAIHRLLMNQLNLLSTRIFTDDRQSDNENPAHSGFEHVAGRNSENPSSVGGTNGKYNGHRRNDH